MELFRLDAIPTATSADDGVPIDKYLSASWTERYEGPGEFQISGLLSSGLHQDLPIGSFISHIDTPELMVVENLHIVENEDAEPTVSISGRSIEALLETRLGGINWVRAYSDIRENVFSANETWQQAMAFIRNHATSGGSGPSDPDDELSALSVDSIVTLPGTVEERTFDQSDVLSQVLATIKIDDIGIRSFRASKALNVSGTMYLFHHGVDQTDRVIFSQKAGDLTGAEYFWSTKTEKTSAIIKGKYVNVVYDGPETGLDRKFISVDGSAIDEHLNAMPSGSTLAVIENRMRSLGKRAVMNQNAIHITRADVSDLSNFRYRRDYDIGDLVTVDGNYGEIQTMRVVEYVEIQDENGESGHPTLSVPGGTTV